MIDPRDYTTDPWTDLDETFIPLDESQSDYDERCERDAEYAL